MTTDSARYDFETAGPVDLKVELSSGSIEVTAADVATTTVELEALHGDSFAAELIANARVEQHGDKISVLMHKGRGSMFGRKGQVSVIVTMPTGSSIRADTGSADVTGHGRLGAVIVNTGSGDVELEAITSGELKLGSGNLEIEAVADSLRAKSGSGDITVGPIGGSGDITAGSGDVVVEDVSEAIKVKTGSGDVVLKTAGERTNVMAGSGDLLLHRVGPGKVVAKTGSGDVSIGVTRGTAALLDVQTVTGSFTCHLDATDQPADGDDTVSINVMSGTGDVVLQHA